MCVENDVDLGENICVHDSAAAWTGAGAVCTIRFIFPTSGTTVSTGAYAMDFNVRVFDHLAGAGTGDINGIGLLLTTFDVDNRFISLAVEALLNIITVLLIAAAVVGIALAFLGKIEPKTALILAVAASISVIATIVVAVMIEILVP